MANNDSRPWSGFLTMAFVVLGLCGLFATYAAQLPYQREFFAEAKLDAAIGAPDAAARLDMLRSTLGEDGLGAFPATGDVRERIETARHILRRHFQEQAADIALRLRIVIVVFTGAAALFGLMVVSILRRPPT
jgi:hypothetical protein